MNKLVLSACALLMGGMLMSSCSNDDDSPVKKEIINNHQAENYVKIGQAVGILSGVDATQGAALATDMQSIAPQLAIGQSFANAVQTQWRAWGMTWLSGINVDATEGHAGKLPKGGDVKKPVVVDANGVEIAQLVKKGAIGMYTFSGALNEINKIGQKGSYNPSIFQNVVAYYLGDYKYLNMPQTNSSVEGKTSMNYQFGEGCEFAKYVNAVNHMAAGTGLGDQFIGLLKTASTQLNDNNQLKATLLQAQAIAQKIIMVRCCFYLKLGSRLYSEGGMNKAFHPISEGLGFYYSLQCSVKPNSNAPYYTYDQVNAYLNGLNLWKQEAAQKQLEQLKNELEKSFSIDDKLL